LHEISYTENSILIPPEVLFSRLAFLEEISLELQQII
jgi:hypothetical protein